MEVIRTILIFMISVAKGQRWFAATDLDTNTSDRTGASSNRSIVVPEFSNFRPSVEDEGQRFMPIPFLQTPKTPSKERIIQKGFKKNSKLPQHLQTLKSSQTRAIEGFQSVNATPKFDGLRRRKCSSLGPKQSLRRQESGLNPRFLDVFHVVNIANVGCASSSGLEGTCLHRYECEGGGGMAMGDCADGYGVCCVRQSSCGDTAAAAVSWFTNPGYPSPSTERLSCALTVDKAGGDIVQVRLDLMTFELLPPTGGSCEQDQFAVSGHNVNSIVPILCGINNGQHLYIDVRDMPGPVYLSLQTVTPESRLFAIKVTQLTAADELAAPTGCLQHYAGTTGVLESFNYQDTSALSMSKNPSYLNNMNYAMCIRRTPDACSITYTNADAFHIPNYDECDGRCVDGLPVIPSDQAGVEIFNCPADWLLASAARLCGERLNDGSVLQDFSMDAPVTDSSAGPIVVWFRSDGSSVGRGFRLQFAQNACTAS